MACVRITKGLTLVTGKGAWAPPATATSIGMKTQVVCPNASNIQDLQVNFPDAKDNVSRGQQLQRVEIQATQIRRTVAQGGVRDWKGKGKAQMLTRWSQNIHYTKGVTDGLNSPEEEGLAQTGGLI